jgi:hypothetical protein
VDGTLSKLLDELGAVEADMTKGPWEQVYFPFAGYGGAISDKSLFLGEFTHGRKSNFENRANARGVVLMRNNALAQALRDMDEQIVRLKKGRARRSAPQTLLSLRGKAARCS